MRRWSLVLFPTPRDIDEHPFQLVQPQKLRSSSQRKRGICMDAPAHKVHEHTQQEIQMPTERDVELTNCEDSWKRLVEEILDACSRKVVSCTMSKRKQI